jgi:glycosyltransferase involved in cell wall biosynthesis
MGMGQAILYRDCAATREVLGDAGQPFGATGTEEGDVEDLAEWLDKMSVDDARCAELGRGALERVHALYSWEAVADRYEALFAEIREKKWELPGSR